MKLTKQKQLETLGNQNNIETLEIFPTQKPLEIALRAKKTAETENFDVLILDSAGRNHIDLK